jgi:ketosteroid isomerase-like protein
LLAGLAAASTAEAPEGPAAVVEAFHAALAAGDRAAAEALLAPDAIVLEGGHVETRAEYLAHHLAADVEFARAVAHQRRDVRVVTQGEVAWVSARSNADGEIRGRTIRNAGAELIVLSRDAAGWRIRAIHWSSHERARAAEAAPPSEAP